MLEKLIKGVAIALIFTLTCATLNASIVSASNTEAQSETIKTPYHKIKVQLNVSWITIDTPYGQLNVDNETLKKLGKEEVIKRYKNDFLDVKTKEKNDAVLKNIKIPSYILNSNSKKSIGDISICSFEDIEAYARNRMYAQGGSPTTLYGHTTLFTIYNPDYNSWDLGCVLHEREIGLLNGDRGEFIVEYRPDGSCRLGFSYCPYGGQHGYYYYGPYVQANINHQYTYNFVINSNTYSYWWYDESTGQAWLWTVTPSDYGGTYSNQITQYWVSSEIDSWINSGTRLLLKAQFDDVYTKVNNQYYYVSYFFYIDNIQEINNPCRSNSWYTYPYCISSLSQIGFNPYP